MVLIVEPLSENLVKLGYVLFENIIEHMRMHFSWNFIILLVTVTGQSESYGGKNPAKYKSVVKQKEIKKYGKQGFRYDRTEIQKIYPEFGKKFLILYDGDDNARVGFLDETPDEERLFFHEAPSDDNVIFTLFTRNSPPQNVTSKTISQSAFDPKKKTKFVLHGWMSNGRQDTCLRIKNNYMKNYDFNVFIVDWGYFADTFHYLGVLGHIKDVARFFAEFLTELMQAGAKPEDIHLIGHSLGAQLSGYAGKKLTKKIGRITGLDPARPGFYDSQDRLNKSDANFVDIIHTCGGFLSIYDTIGHADFYPNGGSVPQPGCELLSELTEACSHGKSWKYYAASLAKENPMKAQKCQDYYTFKDERDKCQNFVIPVGEETPKNAIGKFYFDTLPEKPYVKDLSVNK